MKESFDIDSDIEAEVSMFLSELKSYDFISDNVSPSSTETGPLDDYPDIADAPTGLDLSLTKNCNLRCPYCFYDHIMEDYSDLDLNTWKKHFLEFKSLSVRTLSLTGGEVFTRSDIWELIDSIIECRMRYSILSNGTLIDSSVIDRFGEGRRRLRMDSIQVSVDGSCAGIHDKIRGPGAFEAVMRGLKLLVENNFPCIVRVTINKFNVLDLPNIARLLLDEVGLPSFSTNDAVPIGAGCDNRLQIGLTAEQKLQAMEILHQLNDLYGNRITSTAGPVALWTYYRNMERAVRDGKDPGDHMMGYLTACGCIFQRLAVHHDGSITPCHMMPDLVIGKLGQDSIPNIWKSHPVLKAMRKRSEIHVADIPFCADCEWNEVCNGSCPAIPYQMTGDLNTGNLHDCYRLFLKQTGNKKPWAIFP